MAGGEFGDRADFSTARRVDAVGGGGCARSPTRGRGDVGYSRTVTPGTCVSTSVLGTAAPALEPTGCGDSVVTFVGMRVGHRLLATGGWAETRVQGSDTFEEGGVVLRFSSADSVATFRLRGDDRHRCEMPDVERDAGHCALCARRCRSVRQLKA